VRGAPNATLDDRGALGVSTVPPFPSGSAPIWVSDVDIRAMCGTYAPGPGVRAIGAEPDARIGCGPLSFCAVRPL
jgi:hypothetical protein